ncbi:MAG: tetratricopeptide repeat protein [Bacteriovoracaceae bacterium]
MNNSTTNELLKSLETLYTKAKYQEAIDLLLKNKESFDPGLFHYNLGSLYLKNKNLPVARFHLEKAYHLGFQVEEVLNNIKVTEAGLDLSTLESSGNQFTDNFYQALFLPASYMVGYFLMISLIVLWIKKWKKVSWLATSLFFLLLVSPLIVKFSLSQSLNVAVALKASHSKEGPSAIFENNHDIPAGLRLIVTKPKEGWYFIQYPTHLSGWIKSEDLGIM